jgi:membrane protease YdiL (CAAX protease family)
MPPDPEPESDRLESDRLESARAGAPPEPRADLIETLTDYFTVTRGPLYSIVVSAPFFIAYELGIAFLKDRQPTGGQVRNLAEYILHRFTFGLGQLAYLLPAAAGMGLLYFLHWRGSRTRRRKGSAPDEFRPRYAWWMLAEGLVLALPLPFLFGEISARLAATAGGAGGAAGAGAGAGAQGPSLLFELTGACGAGAYEELLFRLFLFNGLLWFGHGLLRLEKLPAGILAAVVTAVVFALLHPAGNPACAGFRPAFFAFATLAGIYFAAICYFRSFGTAVATHASYDIMLTLLKHL